MRLLFKLLLFTALLGALAVVLIAVLPLLGWQGGLQADALNALAAALAVITAVIAAWGAQKVIEREDDARRPLPDLTVDVSSRYALAQLVLRNFGGTPAFDVRIHWDAPLLDSDGNMVSFSERADGVAASVLPNGERVMAFIDAVSNLVKRKETIYSGELIYAERPGGKRKTRKFALDLGKYRQTLIFSDELPRTLHELQAIPGNLDGIRDELQQLRSRLGVLEYDRNPGSDT
jgi:hypothetical protein